VWESVRLTVPDLFLIHNICSRFIDVIHDAIDYYIAVNKPPMSRISIDSSFHPCPIRLRINISFTKCYQLRFTITIFKKGIFSKDSPILIH